MSVKNQIFKQVFDLYYRNLHFFAFQLLRDNEMAKDVVQDAFVALWKQQDLQTIHEKSLRSYMYSTVKFMALNKVRHRNVAERHVQGLPTDEFEEDQVIEKMIRAEVMGQLYQALDKLPKGCKEVFRLGYFEGMSNAQIAETLEISVNTVKTHKQRGLKILRTILKPDIFVLLALYLTLP